MFFLCGLGVFSGALDRFEKNVSSDEEVLCNSISPGFSALMFHLFKPYTDGGLCVEYF